MITFLRRRGSLVILLLCPAFPALAQNTLYWSGSALNPNTGGSGNWNQTDAHWSTSSSSYVPATWLNGASLTAVLGGATPGTITITVPGISGTALTVAQNHTLDLNGASASFGTLNFTGAGTNLTVVNGSFAAGMSAGTVTLTGSAAMTVGGSWPVSGGTIVAKNLASVTVANRSFNDGSAQLHLQDSARVLLAGGSLTVGGLVADSTTTLVENGHSIRESSFTVRNTSGTSTFAGTMRDSAAGPQQFAKLNFVKDGAGTLVLSGATKTYSGGTSIMGGTLRMGAANVLPTAAIVGFNTFFGSGQVWDLAGHNQTVGAVGESPSSHPNTAVNLGSATLTLGYANLGGGFSGVVSGSGSIIKIGSGEQTFGGANTYSGGTTVTAGTMTAASSAAFGTGSTVFKGGTSLGIAASTFGGNVTLESGEITLKHSYGQSTLSGVLSGAALLEVKSSGSLRLSGANTFSGGLRLTSGTLEVAADSALGASTGAIQFNGGTLHFLQSFQLNPSRALVLSGAGGSVQSSDGTVTIANALTGTGNFTVNSGYFVLTGQNTFTGAIRVERGSLGVTANALGDAANGISIGYSGTLRIVEDILLEAPRTLRIDDQTPGSTISVDANKALVVAVPLERLSPTTATVLRKDGAGTLMLTTPATFAGHTQVLNGILALAGGENLLPTEKDVHLAIGSSALALVETEQTVNALTGFGTTAVLDSVLRVAGSASPYNGPFTGNGTVIKIGPGTFSTDGASLFTGTYEVQAGSWWQRGQAGDESLTLVREGARVYGAGWLGRLDVQAGGTVAPGAGTGILFTRNATLRAGAKLELDLKNAAGSEGFGWDQLRLNGILSLAGTPANPIVLKLVSRDASDALGLASNFNGGAPAIFRIVRAQAVSGFDPDSVVVDASGFQNSPALPWRVRLANGGQDLVLVHGRLSLTDWRNERFSSAEMDNASISGPLADADGDGLSNLLEFALGTNPRLADAPSYQLAAHADEWHFDYTRPQDREVSCHVEYSTDLAEWSTNGVVHERLQTSAEGRELWRARVPRSVGSAVFMRLRASTL